VVCWALELIIWLARGVFKLAKVHG